MVQIKPFLTIVLLFLGAIQANAQKKISVKACGAKGDGKHNDTEAILYAVKVADTILIPTGSYLINRKLTFKDLRNKTIIATGAIILNTNNNDGTLEFTDGENISVTGGTWTRSVLPREQGKGQEHTFTFSQIKNLTVKDVTINGSPQMGIALIGIVGGLINHNTVTNCCRDGIYAHYSVKLTYSNNYITNIKDDAMSIHDYGLIIQKGLMVTKGYMQAGQSKVINNTCINTYQGFSSIGCNDIYIAGNKISNTVGAGIAISNSETLFKGGTARAKNIIIEKNILSRNGSAQIIMGVKYTNGGQLSTGRSALFIAVNDEQNVISHPKSTISKVTVTNNTISDCGVNGAYIAQVVGLVFKSNSFTNCNTDDSPYCGNIVEVENSANALINNITVIDNRTRPHHKTGYQLKNVTGKANSWNVKGYTTVPGKTIR
jgi:hypothetical protein